MASERAYLAEPMSRLRRLTEEGSWILVGQIVTIAGAVVLVRVLTEYLSPAQYGELALGLTVAGLVNQTVFGAVANGISRFHSIAAEKEGLAGYLQATGRLLGYAALVVVVIGALSIIVLLWRGHSTWLGLAMAAFAYAVLSGFSVAFNGIQNAARQRALVALHGGLDAWLKIGMALGVVLWLGASSLAVVVGYICASIIVGCSQLFFLGRAIRPRELRAPDSAQWMSRMWAYSLPFSLWGVFTWLQQASDRWALQAYGSSAEVGQYTVLFQLGYTPVALITSSATSFLAPILYQLSGDATNHARNADVHRLCWLLTQISLFLTVLGVALSFALHEWLFRMLVATDFRGSSYMLPWAVLAGGLFAAGQVLGLKLMSEIRSSEMTRAKIVTALIGALLNAVGAALAGIEGVVAALVAFSAMYFVWMAALARNVPTTPNYSASGA